MGDMQCRGAAAARQLAATALRDCTTRLDMSASLTNTVFSPLFYPHASHRPHHINARGYTPRILQSTNHDDDYATYTDRRPTTPNIIYYTHITYLLCSTYS